MTPTLPTRRRALVAALASAALCLSLLAAQPAFAQSTPDPAVSTASPSPSDSPITETPDPTPQPGETGTASPSPEATSPEVVETPEPVPSDEPAPTPSPSVTGGPAIAAAAAFSATLAEASAAVAGFQAGNIINDATFTNKNTMSASSIDTFFRKMVGTCQSGYTCLKDYRQNTPNRSADSYCSGYSGAANESAATIIYKVSQSCNINPQVLIVMLQKEQGLVTHTWPSQWRYDMALGQGCPDTAPCDPAFAGFFYQIYGAARQMNIYMEGRYFTYYPAGRTSNIYWHPNASCGAAPVYISNKATSALYYYTPYQPNRAALNAGYGEGDGCSSYGNRNFYLYFNQWFGSTQGGGTPTTPADNVRIIRASDAPAVYLAAGGTRYQISTAADLDAYTATFGSIVIVSSAEVSRLGNGGVVTRSVRDPRNGAIYLLESDRTKHRFRTVESVTQFGYRAENARDLPASVMDAFATGAEVGSVYRVGTGSQVFTARYSRSQYVYDATALGDRLGAESTYVATMDPAAAARITAGATYFGDRRLVRAASSAMVYLTTPTGTLVPVPSLDLAALFGASGVTAVADSSVSSSAVTRTTLLPAVACGQEVRVLDGSAWRRVTNATNVRTTKLTAADCEGLPAISGATLTGPIFARPASGSAVYYFDPSGSLRHVVSYADLVALNGAPNRAILTVSWAQAAITVYGVGNPLVAREGALLSFAGDPAVYVVQKNTIRHVLTWTSLVSLSGGSTPSVDPRAASVKASFTLGKPYLADRNAVRFGNADEIYIAESGKLRYVATWDTFVSYYGGQIPNVDSLPTSQRSKFANGTPLLKNGSFARFGTDPKIYYMDGTSLRHVTTWEAYLRLGGNATASGVAVVPGKASDYPIGSPIS